MTNQSKSVGVADRATRFNPASEYVWIPFTSPQTGDDQTIYYKRTADSTEQTITNTTLTGTPADTIYTAKPGWMRPDGTNSINLQEGTNGTNLATIFAPDAAGAHLLFINLDVAAYIDGANVDDWYLFQWGRFNHASDGAYSMEISTAANMQFKARVTRTTGGSQAGTIVVGTTAKAYPIWVYIDWADMTNSLMGIAATTSGATDPSFTTSGSVPTLPTGFTVNMLAQWGTGPAESTPLTNAGTPVTDGDYASIHDFWCFKFATPPSTSELNKLLIELGKNPWERPATTL